MTTPLENHLLNPPPERQGRGNCLLELASSQFQPLFRQLGIDGDTVFDYPGIVCWRKLPDRENCLLDADLPDGQHVRLHIKRYLHKPIQGIPPADCDALGTWLLEDAHIPTARLLAKGRHAAHGSFVIYQDLTGYSPGDKLVEQGRPFEPMLKPTAELAAKLHDAGLHHRDLYLCHFMARVDGEKVELSLIDTARVRKLPWFFRSRWIVKDLAQFWYSTLKLPITDQQRGDWLAHYAATRKITAMKSLRQRIEQKARAIARHDIELHRKRPERDLSIPGNVKSGRCDSSR